MAPVVIVSNAPPGDPGRTAQSDQTQSSVVIASQVLHPSGGDDTTQLQNAVNAGGIALLAPGVYTQAGTLDLTSAVGGSLVALGGTSRWRPNVAPPVIINYTGNGNAVQLSISGTTAYDNYTVKGIRWDGTGAGAASVGLLLQTSSTGSPFIEGLLFDDSGFTNFGLNQVVLTGQVFDIAFRRFTAHNCSHGSDNVIQVNAAGSFVPGQLLFDDPWLVQSQNGKWCFFCDASLTQTYRFIAGCATTGNAAGTINTSANGIHCLGKLQLLSTHVEACALGVEWAGESATIIGNEIVSNTTGVAIGSSLNPAFNARGAVVSGVGSNTTDILIRAGGARTGTVIAGATPAISDLRSAIDNVDELIRLTANYPKFPGIGTAANYESTGTGSAALGANCPASTVTAPYRWLAFKTSDGSIVYVPAWK